MSYGLYIGKNHTSDGVAYLAGYGDEPSSHWLEIVPGQWHSASARVRVGVTQDANLPGLITDIPQVAETARHIRVSYSHYKGVPAPLTNGGLNEYGVAVRDIWSPSRAELVEMTPSDQTGPNYSDLARLVLERARTAREGVLIIGALIAEYGHSTYGGNSHLIADAEEAWVVIEFAGGKKLWAAERLGPDSIRASRPGYIGDIPIGSEHPDYLYSPNLVSFAEQAGWFVAGADLPFNLNRVYGDGRSRWEGVKWIEEEMAARSRRPKKIGIEDVMWAVRTPRLTGDTAGYGQVIPLVPRTHDELAVLWHTQIGSVAAPFVPVYIGVRDIPEEFKQHRYLTAGESERFMDVRDPASISIVPQAIESTRSAAAIFKRLLYLVLQHHETYIPEVTAVWEGVERQLLAANLSVTTAAGVLISSGERDLAIDYLTYFSKTELLRALDLAETLAWAFEARTRALYGIKPEAMPEGPEQIW